MGKNFITSKEAIRILNIHYKTLYQYEKTGLIETVRTPSGERLYNVKDYLFKNVKDWENKYIKKN